MGRVAIFVSMEWGYFIRMSLMELRNPGSPSMSFRMVAMTRGCQHFSISCVVLIYAYIMKSCIYNVSYLIV